MKGFWKGIGVAAAVLGLAAALAFGLYLGLRGRIGTASAALAPRNTRRQEDFESREDGTVTYPGALQGVDVSAHQGQIDWQAVKAAGFDFAILRIGFRGYSAGSIKLDERFEENYAGARQAGLEVGVYFYSQAVSLEEALEEADFILQTLSGRELTLPVFFDWEEVSQGRTGGKATAAVSDFARAFCERIELKGYEAGVYFNQAYGYSLMRLSRLKDYAFWLAEYNDHQSFGAQVGLWQYSCNGHIDGISTRVDLDLLYPGEEEE